MPIQKVMQSIVLIAFLNLIFANSISFGAGIIYQPADISKGEAYHLVKGDYEDIRISFSNDRQVNYWIARQGDVEIEQSFKNHNLIGIWIRKYEGNKVKEIKYVRSDKTFKLVLAETRDLGTYYISHPFLTGVKDSQICALKNATLQEEANISRALDDQICHDNLVNKIIDKSCKEKYSPEEYDNLVEGYSKAVGLGQNNKVISCLRAPITAEILASAYGSDINTFKNILAIAAGKYKVEAAKVYNGADALKDTISCEKVSKVTALAKTIERKKIVFYNSADKKNPIDNSKVGFFNRSVHELLHKQDLFDDQLVSDMTTICAGGKLQISKYKEKNKKCIPTDNCGAMVLSKLNTKNTVNKVADNTDAKIPKEIAETAIKNPPPAQIDQPLVDSNKALNEYAQNPEKAAEVAYNTSRGQTGGFFGAATRLLDAMPSGSILPSAQAAGFDTRAPASIPTSGTTASSSGTRVAKIKVANSGSSDSDTFVAEDIIAPQDSSVNAIDNAKSKSAQSKASSGAGYVPGTAAEVTGSSGGSVSSSGGSSGRGNMASSGGGGSGSREPASVDPGLGSSARSKATRESSTLDKEQINVALTTDYQQAQKRLSDPKFVEALQKNKISILNMRGKVIVQSAGQIIYLDTGTNYVRQK
jgi:hypothetical protein